MMDVCLVNPNALEEIYQDLSKVATAIEPPIWAALIANSLRSANLSCDILDCEGLQLTFGQAVDDIIARNPKLVCFVIYGQQPSASTQNMRGASVLCQKLKEKAPELKVLFLGGHVSALPERTLKEEACDFVCKGEGISTLLELVSAGVDNDTAYHKIPGLYYKEGGEILKSDVPAQMIPQERLSLKMPGMAFDLLPMKNYRAHNWHCFSNLEDRGSYASVYTSLGCPFKCSFCCINAPFNRNAFRFWEPEFIIQQFDQLVNVYGVKNIKIADEMFVLNENHYLKLCKLLIERNYNLNIWAYARVDTVKEKNLALMKKAGINWLALGIESKSKFVRSGVSKGQFQEASIPGIVKKIQDAGINVMGNYIFGLPDDTYETMNETLEMALELNCEMANFYSAMAYPGSQLYTMAVQNDWKLPENWIGYSQHSRSALPLQTKTLSGAQVLGFRDAAWKKHFTDQNYLSMLERKFGQAAADHIRDVAKIDLARDNIVEYTFKD